MTRKKIIKLGYGYLFRGDYQAHDYLRYEAEQNEANYSR